MASLSQILHPTDLVLTRTSHVTDLAFTPTSTHTLHLLLLEVHVLLTSVAFTCHFDQSSAYSLPTMDDIAFQVNPIPDLFEMTNPPISELLPTLFASSQLS